MSKRYTTAELQAKLTASQARDAAKTTVKVDKAKTGTPSARGAEIVVYWRDVFHPGSWLSKSISQENASRFAGDTSTGTPSAPTATQLALAGLLSALPSGNTDPVIEITKGSKIAYLSFRWFRGASTGVYKTTAWNTVYVDKLSKINGQAYFSVPVGNIVAPATDGTLAAIEGSISAYVGASASNLALFNSGGEGYLGAANGSKFTHLFAYK